MGVSAGGGIHPEKSAIQYDYFERKAKKGRQGGREGKKKDIYHSCLVPCTLHICVSLLLFYLLLCVYI